MLKQILAVAIALAFLAGCNTMQGFGRDVEKLGDKIEDKAGEKKRY